MISDVLSYVSILLVSIIGLALYLFLISRVLPDIFFNPNKHNSRQTGRGIKKFKFNNGRAIVFEPSVKVGKYIKQYIVSLNSGDKYLKCKVDKRIDKMSYTVIAIDAGDKVIDMIDVEDIVAKNGYTKAVVLPTDTSYVDIIVNEVNGCIVADRDKILFSGRSMLIYIGCSALMTAIVSGMTYCIAMELVNMIIGMMIGINGIPGVGVNMADLIISSAAGALVGALIAFLICIPYKNANTRIIPPSFIEKLLKRMKGA